MHEDKLAESIWRAQRASALLNDEMFNEAIEGIKKQLMERWLISKDQNERERIWLSVNITEQIKAILLAHVSNGKLSQRDLEEITSGKKRQQFGVV